MVDIEINVTQNKMIRHFLYLFCTHIGYFYSKNKIQGQNIEIEHLDENYLPLAKDPKTPPFDFAGGKYYSLGSDLLFSSLKSCQIFFGGGGRWGE